MISEEIPNPSGMIIQSRIPSTIFLSSSFLLSNIPLSCSFWFFEATPKGMGISVKQMSIIIATLGILSFIFGVLAENKKPASGTAITRKDVVICKYPHDLTVVLGYLSVGFLAASSLFGLISLFYPYKGKCIPQGAMFQHKGFLIFFNIALATTGLALAMLLWPTITEQKQHIHNVHCNGTAECPTAKTGIIGGGAFLSLDSCLMWLVALMLADNAREDYLEKSDKRVAGVHHAADDDSIKNVA